MIQQLSEYMGASPDFAGKDAAPVDTVARIKEILDKHGIQTEEKWSESNVPYCYSLRINIKDTAIGANGKGINKAFALASGYGELIERLQLGLIWRNKLQIEGGASSCEAQSSLQPAALLWERHPEWYCAYGDKLKQTTGISVTGEELLRQYTDKQGNVQATAFYCLTTQELEYLPTVLCKTVYATSGGAAGNTIEEAMVQAFSEIIERHHKLHVIQQDFPEETLQTSKIAYKIISFLRDNGYRVQIKDASLGTGFPVLCVCLIDTNTGKYHTHFGASPDFHIALQRTLTETFQGRNLENVAKHEDFQLDCEHQDLRYLLRELVKGTSEKPPQFFRPASSDNVVDPSFSFGTTNRERLKGCIAFFRDQGYDILVRDSSALGFPTYQVIIPGYSEALPQRMSDKYDDNRFSGHAVRALRNPAAAAFDDYLGVLMHINQSKKLKMNGLESYTTEAGLPARISAGEEVFLMSTSLAYIHYELGRYKEAATYIAQAVSNCRRGEVEYLLCLKRYLALKQAKYTAESISEILSQFHKPQTVGELYSCLEKKQNPLLRVVLKCDLENCDGCKLYGRCKKRESDSMAQMVAQKAQKLDQLSVKALLAYCEPTVRSALPCQVADHK